MNNVGFTYTGSTQTWTVPNGVTEIIVSAQGASGQAPSNSSYSGGKGAVVSAILPVTPGDTLNVYVGGQSAAYGGTSSNGIYSGDGTFLSDATSQKLLVAAGGGGASDGNGNGGNAGQVGANGTGSGPGGGATQSAAGTSPYQSGSGPAGWNSFGHGGAGADGGSGGGGYYGGGGGGQITTSYYSYPNGTYTSNGTTSQSMGTSTSPQSGVVSGSSDPTSDNGAPYVYNQSSAAYGVYTVTHYTAGWPNYNWNGVVTGTTNGAPNGSSYSSSTTSSTDSAGHTAYYYNEYTYDYTVYNITQYTETFSENYSQGSSSSVTETGGGGGGSSFVTSQATNVSYSTATTTGNGSLSISWGGDPITMLVGG